MRGLLVILGIIVLLMLGASDNPGKVGLFLFMLAIPGVPILLFIGASAKAVNICLKSLNQPQGHQCNCDVCRQHRQHTI